MKLGGFFCSSTQYGKLLFLLFFVVALYNFLLFQPILEAGAVVLLASLTRRSEKALKLNGIWALMVSKLSILNLL